MISIIVPVFNRPDLTELCIDSVLNYTKDFELILVQEGENEEIKNLLLKKTKDSRVTYLQNKVPKGYSGALNAGLTVARGDYYCFMNNDVAVIPNWLDKMLKGFEGNVGMVVPFISGGSGIQVKSDWKKREVFEDVPNPFAIMGVCFLVKKEVIDKIGNWDEDFFFGGEDWDIAHRILEANYRIVLATNAYIFHYCGASAYEYLDGNNDKLFEKIQANIKQIEKKHNILYHNYDNKRH